jgi:hypothetical protein
LSDQAGDYGRAEIETHKTSFSKSKRLAFLASFNPDISPRKLSKRRLGTVLSPSALQMREMDLSGEFYPGLLQEFAWLVKNRI